jgi:predicted amidohydrolase
MTMRTPILPWRATCMQVYTYGTNRAKTRAESMAVVNKSLDRWLELLDNLGRYGGEKQLALFPEFALQGFPGKESAADWIEKSCFEIPGSPEIARLQNKAKELGIFIGANAYERDPEWPGRFFNCSFLIDDQGDIVLKYRRINTQHAGSPHDFMDKYLARYGVEGIFPVAKTKLGNIGMIPCGEIMYPEAARAVMFRGAEVLLHPTSDFGAWDNWSWQSCKKARASENMMYLISANSGGIRGTSVPETENAGRSRIFDWEGRTLAEGPSPGESMRCNTLIDVEALRRVRSTEGGFNRIVGIRTEIYRLVYDTTVFFPANSFADAGMESRAKIREARHNALSNLAKVGAIPPLETDRKAAE